MDWNEIKRATMQTCLGGLVVVGVGCGEDDAEPQLREGNPEILALSTYSAPMGTPVQILGMNFENEIDDRGIQPFSEITFQGVFEANDGSLTEVNVSRELRRSVDGRLTLDSLGPYSHPFSDREVVGTFRGTAQIRFFEVTAALTRGEILAESDPQDLEFTIEPSIFITSFKPLGAQCVAPVPAVLAEFPYQITARAVGFEADSFRFTMEATPSPFDDGRVEEPASPVVLDVVAKSNVGQGGLAAGFRPPPMPYQGSSYALTVRASARGNDGKDYETQFALSAYNPIVIYDSGPPELAQTYQPVPIGSCQEGAVAPTRVTYVDSESVTRTRSESRSNTDSFSEALARGETVSLGRTTSDSTSYSLTEGESNTNGFSHSHEFGIETTIGGKIGKFFGSPKVSYKGKFEISRSTTTNESETNSRSSSFGRTSTSTDTETVTNTQAQARTAGTSETQSSTVLNSFSISADVFPGSGAVWYRQESRYIQRAVITRYTLCGEELVIGETSFPDYRWSVELADGDSCTPLPEPTDLAPAQCYLPPCNGN